MKKILILLIFSVFSIDANAANSSIKVLDHFFKDLQTLSADFVQLVENAQLNATERAEGKLWIQRPGKFRWNYEKPYLQEIVSNGEKIWIYDADLEQVTIKPSQNTLGNTPALLLSDEAPLDASFDIQDLGRGLGLNWVELTPKDREAGFGRIRLGFHKAELEEMRLEDNLGQTTRIIFSDLKRNAPIKSGLFVFTPPDNADIFDNTKSSD